MKPFIEIKFGSHLYGTNTENSDLDLKGIYLPTAKEICLHSFKRTITTCRPKQTHERNNKDDVDLEIFSLDRYVELLTDGQAVALDMFFAPHSSYTKRESESIILAYMQAARGKFLSKSMTSAFFGYAKQQAAKYGIKGHRVAALREMMNLFAPVSDHTVLGDIPSLFEIVTALNNPHIKFVNCKGPQGQEVPHLEICEKKYALNNKMKHIKEGLSKRFDEYGHRALLAEKNEGVDWKALSHAVRVNSQAVELLLTRYITFPRPDAELLLKIKTGQMDYKLVAEIIEQGLEDIKSAHLKSDLPETHDKEYCDNFVFQIYSNIVKGIKL